MKILQLTVHFSPNLGGVETHLDDLVAGLAAKRHQVFVLTYRPLSVNANWKIWQKQRGGRILRLPWWPGWFNKLAKIPAGEFLYLVPGLFIALPWVLLFFRPEVIHAHGLSAGVAGVFWRKVFGVRTVLSTHSIYNFPSSGLYRSFARWIFQNADYNLCLSTQSVNELISLGVPQNKIGRFTYWVDLEKFRPLNKDKCKQELGWQGQFVVLFVGRLVEEKGLPELLQAAKLFDKHVSLKIAGSGPMESEVRDYYIGRISQEKLPVYYSAADVVIVPSTHEEGFGRVIIESLACGTPVVAANRGAIPEAMDNSIGKLINVTSKNIADTINDLQSDKAKLHTKTQKARDFAVRRYSDLNINNITDLYV